MSLPSMEDLFDLATPESDAVVEARLGLFVAATDQLQVLGSFTDEELVGLDGPDGAATAPSPWYSSLSEAEQQTALTAALRGLTARGVYRAIPIDSETATFAFHADPQVLALLSMRRYTGVVVVAERQTADQRDWAVLYQQRDGLWLTELVNHVGQHEFVLATGGETAQLVTTWSGAPSDVAAPDLDVVLTRDEVAGQDPVLEQVGRSTAAITVTRLDLPDPEDPDADRSVEETWSGVFTGPGGGYVSTAVGDDVGYHGVDLDGVLHHWRDVIGAA
ncbi:hypothetical protein [Cellulomonas sp. PhB150]|uniref:hypothetical protein n=1 Tax=Cellulomonas sp. PhB150 TaxID=2485188 RepID=UPI000F461B2D|nr:hypothetical protein [Cellulomonas sp. PhB150]